MDMSTIIVEQNYILNSCKENLYLHYRGTGLDPNNMLKNVQINCMNLQMEITS
jgi:hypothetical protein